MQIMYLTAVKNFTKQFEYTRQQFKAELYDYFEKPQTCFKHRFKNQNKKLGISYIFVFLSIILLLATKQIKLAENELYYLIFATIITLILLWSLKNILIEIRNKKLDDTKNEEEKFNLMPFGPALLISATICIFYLVQIKDYIFQFLK